MVLPSFALTGPTNVVLTFLSGLPQVAGSAEMREEENFEDWAKGPSVPA